MWTARHFTCGEDHYYRLLDQNGYVVGKNDADQLLMDGHPAVDLFSKHDTPERRMVYYITDHAVERWERRQYETWTEYALREGVTNSFRIDLPNRFPCEAELVAWWCDATGQPYNEESAQSFYKREHHSREIEPRAIEVRVIDFGEWHPAPEVDFPWAPSEIWVRKEPYELQHLYPCYCHMGHLRETIKAWLDANAKQLGVKNHYIDQSGSNVYFVDGTSIRLECYWENINAPNLMELRDRVADKISKVKAYVSDMAASAKCPFCAGSGRRHTEAAVSEQGREALQIVRALRTQSNGGKCNRLVELISQIAQLEDNA